MTDQEEAMELICGLFFKKVKRNDQKYVSGESVYGML